MVDYNPSLWGNSAWTFFEYAALGYPDYPTQEDKDHYKQLFYSLEFTIPCKECRMNYGNHILETPIDNYLSNSYSLYEWVIIMENKVNRILNKPIKDHEKMRSFQFKRNLENKGKKCCSGVSKGNLEKRGRELKDLRTKIRAKKNLLQQVKDKRKLKRRKE